MQNAGQYVPGTANAHPPQQFAPSEPSPNGGSTTSSLRQFRKRDVDKSQLEQPSKQESHVARVAPHNHYPPVSNDLYRYPSHQFPDYSPQVKYSDIADPSQPNPISTSVIQKSKPKDYMEMCNLQQHLSNQQPYSPDNGGQYMHRDLTQGYPAGFKPDAHYLPKDQHQYQQLAHHSSQSKYNPMVTQNLRKYNPGPPDNPFLNKLSKIHPSMARSIISDHHLQEPQPSYSPMDQRGIYGQQNHRYYTGSLHQSNPYAPNSNYALNHPQHYPNYPPAACNYTRTPTIGPRYSHMDRSMSPTRRLYPENMHMNHISYHNMTQKMPSGQHYSPQYAGTPEYAQHYQHRRIGQDCYPPQSCRPTQYMQNHHQIPAQEMQELPESRISPSDSLKKFIENWAADEEPSNEVNPMESNMNLRENIKVRDDAPPGTVYMINATDVQYFENNGIPIVTSDNGGIQLTSENYQYLLKNGLVDNSGMVRIIEANKEVSTDSNGNHERIVNLQIMEASKSDCMMVSKSLRPSDSSTGSNGMLPKTDDENRRVVIHQNTVISPGNSSIVSERIPIQQPQNVASSQDAPVETTSISKELVDKNCSPINLDQLEHNLGFSEPEPPETESDKNQNSSIPVPSTVDSTIADSSNKPCCNEISLSEDISQYSDDSLNKSPESKSMPIIDLFGDSHVEVNESPDANESQSQKDLNIFTNNDENTKLAGSNLDSQNEKTSGSEHEEISKADSVEDPTNQDKNKSICNIREEPVGNKNELLEDCPIDHASSQMKRVISNNNSVIVSPEAITKDVVLNEDTKDTKYSETSDFKILNQSLRTIDKDIDDMNILESFKSEPGEQVTVGNCLPVESQQTELILESIEVKNETKSLDENKTLVDSTTVIERRKRIFSVDDIIHHIGNNIKRGSREFDVFCSTQILTTFMEKEIEFSSIEQILNNYIVEKSSNKVKQDEIIPTSDHINDIADSNKLVAIVKSCSGDQQPSMCDPINDNQQKILASKTVPGIDDDRFQTVPAIDDSAINLKPLNETLMGDKEINLTDEKVENERIEEEIESMEDEMTSIEESVQLSPEEEITSVEESIQSSSDLAVVEPDERSNTPNVLQYRNAIRVEEPSVLLQISGELMEISVNIVNGKKVITVLPLSDSTVVDYNDNYEVSAIAQDSETVQIDDSEISSEKVEVAENTIDQRSEENMSDQIGGQVEDIGPPKIRQSTSVDVEEISEVIPPEEQTKEELKQGDKENIQAITEKCVNKVKEYKVLEEENNVEIQEEPAVSIDANKLFKLEKYDADQKTESEILETKAKIHRETSITEESIPDIPKIDNDEVFSFSESPEAATQVVAGNTVDSFIGEEVIKSIDSSSIVESVETSETPEILTSCEESLQFSQSANMSIIEDTVEAANETDDLTAGNRNSIDIFSVANDIIVQQAEKGPDIPYVVENSSKPDAYDIQNINCHGNKVETDKTSMQAVELKYYTDESAHDETDCENNVSDVDSEHIDYQLEDDVFISEEPSHEIIISGPLEDVGLIEEVGKTSDSFDIPLEQVTASDDIIETPSIISVEKLEDDTAQLGLKVPNKMFINIGDNVLPKDIIEQREQMTLAVKEEISNFSEDDAEATAYKSTPSVYSTKKTLLIQIAKNKEIVVKPEVQILSPTSTNIDDHITTSKENVYLPRRRLHTDDDSESTFTTITTKAAKKSYDCDLQIPAVTTSGDISTKVSKKLMKDQHDTVSSSKKERVVKDLPRTKKSTLKRSKRINEKNKMKNEQKEMLKLLTEKRKQRKEAKQKELLLKEEDRQYTEDNVETRNNVSKSVEKTDGSKQKHSTEHDDEYVDFKELLRARKLKKLKKMQEIKRREAKDIKIKIEEAHKIAAKDANKSTNKKAVKIHKSVVTVNSDCDQENKAEMQNICCIGCTVSVKKSERDDQDRGQKRKNSSDGKIDVIKPINVKMVLSSSVDIKNVTSETADLKPNISTDLSTARKVIDNISAPIPKANADEDKSKIKTDLPIEMKSEKFLQAPAMINVNIKEIPTQVPIETPAENICISKKVNFHKRVSFCDDISSSTSHNDIGSISATEEIASSKTKTYPASTLKDPRKRARSYAGQIMVPSVSELIEENSGAVYKKKISLADYVSRKRKTSTEHSDKAKPEEKECIVDKKTKLANSSHEIVEFVETCVVPSSFKSEEVSKISKKTMKDVKTSFVIHSSDWEDSQSPLPTIIQSNDECLIQNFSGLNKSKSTRPVIDVNELTPLENIENPKDKKLQEYKDKVDSQLSSLNIHIPKIKPQNLENKRCNVDLVPPHHGSPESSTLIRKFLSSEKITQSEMEKIKKIISYKRFIQHQKNATSPSKSPASSSSAYSHSPACSSYEPTCLAGKSPVSSGSVYSDLSDPAHESKHRVRSDVDLRKKRLHLKKVNAKRKLHLEYDDESSNDTRHKKNVDYSVINRLGKDGLPKIIFKRNRQCTISDSQLVVELERIDNNLELVEEKYNVTVTQFM